MRFTELETERLLLRKLYESDFPIVYDWLGNSENMKYRKKTLSKEYSLLSNNGKDRNA